MFNKKPDPRPEPMTHAAIKRAVAARLEATPARLLAELRNADLPEALDAFALSKLAGRMDGVRLLFVSWTPRPPLEPNEEAGFFAALDEIIEQQVAIIVTEQIEQRGRTAAHAKRRLEEWNMTRDAYSDTPSPAARRAMVDPAPGERRDDGVPHLTADDRRWYAELEKRQAAREQERAERTGQ